MSATLSLILPQRNVTQGQTLTGKVRITAPSSSINNNKQKQKQKEDSSNNSSNNVKKKKCFIIRDLKVVANGISLDLGHTNRAFRHERRDSNSLELEDVVGKEKGRWMGEALDVLAQKKTSTNNRRSADNDEEDGDGEGRFRRFGSRRSSSVASSLASARSGAGRSGGGGGATGSRAASGGPTTRRRSPRKQSFNLSNAQAAFAGSSDNGEEGGTTTPPPQRHSADSYGEIVRSVSPKRNGLEEEDDDVHAVAETASSVGDDHDDREDASPRTPYGGHHDDGDGGGEGGQRDPFLESIENLENNNDSNFYSNPSFNPSAPTTATNRKRGPQSKKHSQSGDTVKASTDPHRLSRVDNGGDDDDQFQNDLLSLDDNDNKHGGGVLYLFEGEMRDIPFSYTFPSSSMPYSSFSLTGDMFHKAHFSLRAIATYVVIDPAAAVMKSASGALQRLMMASATTTSAASNRRGSKTAWGNSGDSQPPTDAEVSKAVEGMKTSTLNTEEPIAVWRRPGLQKASDTKNKKKKGGGRDSSNSHYDDDPCGTKSLDVGSANAREGKQTFTISRCCGLFPTSVFAVFSVMRSKLFNGYGDPAETLSVSVTVDNSQASADIEGCRFSIWVHYMPLSSSSSQWLEVMSSTSNDRIMAKTVGTIRSSMKLPDKYNPFKEYGTPMSDATLHAGLDDADEGANKEEDNLTLDDVSEGRRSTSRETTPERTPPLSRRSSSVQSMQNLRKGTAGGTSSSGGVAVVASSSSRSRGARGESGTAAAYKSSQSIIPKKFLHAVRGPVSYHLRVDLDVPHASNSTWSCVLQVLPMRDESRMYPTVDFSGAIHYQQSALRAAQDRHRVTGEGTGLNRISSRRGSMQQLNSRSNNSRSPSVQGSRSNTPNRKTSHLGVGRSRGNSATSRQGGPSSVSPPPPLAPPRKAGAGMTAVPVQRDDDNQDEEDNNTFFTRRQSQNNLTVGGGSGGAEGGGGTSGAFKNVPVPVDGRRLSSTVAVGSMPSTRGNRPGSGSLVGHPPPPQTSSPDSGKGKTTTTAKQSTTNANDYSPLTGGPGGHGHDDNDDEEEEFNLISPSRTEDGLTTTAPPAVQSTRHPNQNSNSGSNSRKLDHYRDAHADADDDSFRLGTMASPHARTKPPGVPPPPLRQSQSEGGKKKKDDPDDDEEFTL